MLDLMKIVSETMAGKQTNSRDEEEEEGKKLLYFSVCIDGMGRDIYPFVLQTNNK